MPTIVEHGVGCLSPSVTVSVHTVQTKWLKTFPPNLVGSPVYLAIPSSPFILKVKSQGHRVNKNTTTVIKSLPAPFNSQFKQIICCADAENESVSQTSLLLKTISRHR